MTGELNFAWAREIVGVLYREGVTEVEVAPGSRSAPLVLAVRSFPGIHARVHLDERSAAFFALGYGRRSGRPAAVVTTSGTAVANLLPAVVEADASDVPVIIVTADRPGRLRGADAPQTIDQPGIFGPRLRFEADLPVPEPDALPHAGRIASEALGSAVGPPAGPVHLNVPFDKPLHPSSPAGVEVGDERASSSAPGSAPERGSPGQPDDAVERGAARVADRLAAARRPILVAGPSSAPDAEGPALAEFAERLRIPLLADSLSGARFTARARRAAPARLPVCGAYDHYLRDPAVVERLAPDLILRTGRTPTSVALETALERWRDAAQVVIDAGRRPKDHQRLADDYVRAPAGPVLARVAASASGAPADPWRTLWSRAEAAAWSAVEEAVGDPANEGAYAAAVLGALPSDATLFVASSMPVRDLDTYCRPASREVRVLANRGANGIDGTVSSVLGCAAGGAGPVVGLLGDLAFYHDMNGLLAARDPELNVVLVLVDNDGGGIFHMLPIRAFEPAFTPYFATPHGLDFRHAARLYDIRFRDVHGPAQLAEAVAAAVRRPGTEIVRVRTDRETNRRRHEGVREEAARRAAAALGLAADR